MIQRYTIGGVTVLVVMLLGLWILGVTVDYLYPQTVLTMPVPR